MWAALAIGSCTKAGEYVNDLIEKMDERRAALIEHVRRRTPADQSEYDALCRILLKYETDCGADLGQMVLITEQLKGKNPDLVGRA